MMDLSRRGLIVGAGASAALSGCATHWTASSSRPALPPLFDDLERRTFNFFWEQGRADNGLMPDRWPTPSFSSIAAVGFALTAYPIGVERGWITRRQARDRTLSTLRFFDRAPQGEAASGTAGHRGFFYHFLDMDSGARYRDTELSSVDSSLLFLGMLFAAEWFDGRDPLEAEIRRLGRDIVERADWTWFQRGRGDISMGWHPGRGFIDRGWTGYNEGMMVSILALGATRHPASADAWTAWTASYPSCWRGSGETRHLAFAPMFGHQYSHVWIDFRGIRDAEMRRAGFDYFENSRRATFAQRAYAIANPMGWAGYSKDVWGLTACDGPGNFRIVRDGRSREIRGYSARGPIGQPDQFDDGTIAPTAVLGSLPFAPEICVPAIESMHRLYGRDIYRQYGFADSFNPSIRDRGLRLDMGAIMPDAGWVATDHLGIDQGPILAMLANYRDGSIWRRMRRSPTIRRGLTKAGFTGGWLDK